MSILKKLFKKEEDSAKTEKPIKHDIEITASGNTIKIGDLGSIVIGSSTVGSSTGSTMTDFYVYEWFIKKTGEVFYVGKGRGDRYKERHERAYEAERIRELYDTDVKFVAKNLTEEQALELETQEMTRILNETNDRLTNRIIPFFTKRDNGFSRSPSAPPLQFETAPVLYACEIDEHYFDVKHRSFDPVDYECLSHPVFIDKGILKESMDIIYGGNFEKYYTEVVTLLENNGSKILKSKYAKSVTSWIYLCDDYVTNYDIDEETAEERIGRRIPAYHLIDVWKLLMEKKNNLPALAEMPLVIHPANTRCPISQVKNLDDWEKGFDAGYKYAEKADNERKAGNIELAITLLDKARYNGYLDPFLYDSYAKAYRKLKDLDNEIDILDEGIAQLKGKPWNTGSSLVNLERQRATAISKLRVKEKIKEKEAMIQAKKAEKDLLKQQAEESKQRRESAKSELQALIKRMREENDFSEEMVQKAYMLSTENRKRAVLQLDDGDRILNLFESVNEAASSAGIAPKTIRDVAQGKYQHGGGYCWIYADDFVHHRD